MGRVFMRVLACCMIAVLLFCNIQLPVSAAGLNLFSSKDEINSEQSALTQEEEGEESTTEEGTEVSTEETEFAEETTETSEQEEETTEESSATEEWTEEIEEETEAATEEETETTTEETLIGPFTDEYTEKTMLAATQNHNVTMPELTSEYFWLQKGSVAVGNAAGDHAIVVKDAQDLMKYMADTYKNGEDYNFIPHKTSDTEITVGGGTSGEVSLSTIEAGSASDYGDVYRGVKYLKSRVFNLENCDTDPYAIYSNVGTWYDRSKNKTYNIDLKLIITGYTYPDSSTQSGMSIRYYDSAYAGFTTHAIGITSCGADTIETTMEFYYHGTETPVDGLKGMIQFIDIDAQQGVDLQSGFLDAVLFDTDESLLRYNSIGVENSSVGYISAGTVNAFSDRNENTTAIGIFSGSSVVCNWTLARCDKKDTGGNALFKESGGYQVPVDGSAEEKNICYSTVRSTGFLGISTDIAMISLPPQVKKNIYSGKIKQEQSDSTKQSLTLEDRDETFTYVVSAASEMTSDLDRAYYKKYVISDMVEAVLEVTGVKVYTGVTEGSENSQEKYSDVTDSFDITTETQEDYKTKVQVKAKDSTLKSQTFYGNNYYVHIETVIRSDEDLKAKGLSIEDWYQTDNHIGEALSNDVSYVGSFAVENKAKLSVSSSMDTDVELESDETAVKIPMRISLKKIDAQSKNAVSGVVFGLFGGEVSNYQEGMEPLLTAKTDKDGVAVFSADTFYAADYGNGPYYIKEIEVPETYENIWDIETMKAWSYEIPTLQSVDLLAEAKAEISQANTVSNQNLKIKEQEIQVQKKNTETGDILSGAEYKLYQWSEGQQKYTELMTLKEGKKSGEAYYYNEKSFANTMDNLGSYKIVESKAPEGCLLTKEEWTFQITNETKADGSNITYTSSTSGKTQQGTLICENPLQRGVLEIIKNDESGNPLSGVTFTVTAAEDIYVPWAYDENGELKENATALVKKGTKVTTLTSNEEGKARSEALYIGAYDVKETAGAAGYIKSEETYSFTFQYGSDDTVAEIPYTLNVSNLLMKPAVNVAKIADKTTDSQESVPMIDQVTGRYLNGRVAGTYSSEEKVEYTITVTNIGNVPIYEINVTDDMGQKNEDGKVLSDYILEDETSYIIPDDGILMSKNGKQVKADVSKSNKMLIVFDELQPGDSVDIPITTKVKRGMANGRNLLNDVYVSASYYNKESDGGKTDKKEVEEGIHQDEDAINIPGTPEVTNTKIADKTSGITVEDGLIVDGERVQGIYQSGDVIDYTIYVKNTGTAWLKEITVTDTISDELKQVIASDTAGFAFSKDSEEKEKVLESNQGSKITAKILNNQQVVLAADGNTLTGEGCLAAGDYIVLHYYATVKEGVGNQYDLANSVATNAVYYNGTKDEEITSPKDEDKVKTPGEPEASVAKSADKTTGITLKDGRYEGTRTEGVYKKGDKVDFTITVSNTGTADLYNIEVTDTFSDDLAKVVDLTKVTCKTGNYETTKKNKAVVSQQKTDSSSKYHFTIDKLAAGDSVTLHLASVILSTSGVPSTGLKNDVEITAQYDTGGGVLEAIPVTEKMKDDDTIGVKSESEDESTSTTKEKENDTTTKSGSTNGKTSTKSSSSPKTGDDNPLVLYLILCIAAAGIGIYSIRRKFR